MEILNQIEFILYMNPNKKDAICGLIDDCPKDSNGITVECPNCILNTGIPSNTQSLKLQLKELKDIFTILENK